VSVLAPIILCAARSQATEWNVPRQSPVRGGGSQRRAGAHDTIISAEDFSRGEITLLLRGWFEDLDELALLVRQLWVAFVLLLPA
jgi:hypothetical protein